MFDWPNAKDHELEIINQFKFLRDKMNTESAIQLCGNAPGCGFLFQLYQAHNRHYEGAFQSYLIFLRTMVPLVSRSEFLYMFPKSCPGCATLQFLCIFCLHPVLENEVNALFRVLLFDPNGDILHRNDIRQMSMMIRQAYKRREDHFPYMGNCLDFKSDSQGFKMAHLIGQLLSSEEFCELMKSNSSIGAQIAHEMLKNLQDSRKQSQQLTKLLTKYQEIISESKLDSRL